MSCSRHARSLIPACTCTCRAACCVRRQRLCRTVTPCSAINMAVALFEPYTHLELLHCRLPCCRPRFLLQPPSLQFRSDSKPIMPALKILQSILARHRKTAKRKSIVICARTFYAIRGGSSDGGCGRCVCVCVGGGSLPVLLWSYVHRLRLHLLVQKLDTMYFCIPIVTLMSGFCTSLLPIMNLPLLSASSQITAIPTLRMRKARRLLPTVFAFGPL